MKCYVHQNTDAVGVCSTCGRGVCNVCVVKIGGRFYCREDADNVFGKKTVAKVVGTDSKRGLAVMAGSIFAYLLGGLAVLASFYVLFAGILSGDLGGNNLFSSLFNPDFSILGPILNYPQSTIIFIGIGVMIFGCIGIAAGFYLWRPAISGALVAIVFGIIGLMVGFWLNSISSSMIFVDGWFIVNGLIIALALFGLHQLMLHPTREPLSKQTRTPRRDGWPEKR